MSKNKRILLGILVLLLLLIIPNMVKAQTITATEKTETSTGKEVEWSYELSGDNITNLKCTNIASVTGNLEIPETIDSHTVTTLGYKAFYECTGITAITLPETVTSFGEDTFYGCSGLTNVTLSENITAIEKYAFQNCMGIKNIVIPNKVTKIEANAFKNCSGLSKITLSNTLTILENECFANCTALTEIELPDTLTTIGTQQYGWYSPFDGCTALKYIKIPKNVVSMGGDLFGDCKNLTIFAEENSTAAEYAKNNNIRYEKIENWEERGKLGSDVTAPTVSSMSLKYSNLIGYYNTTTNDYRIPRGVEIVIIVAFNEQITGKQIPTLVIKCGTGANIELKNGTISGKNIVYTYTIQQKDEGLITAVSLTGGDVTDSSGNKAVLSVKELKAELSSGYVYANGSSSGNTNNNQNNNNNASNQNNSNNNSQDKTNSTGKTDTTVANKLMPYTGRIMLAWIIGIVTVSAIVAHVRYKKLYIK